jgi:hypothetical protein
MSEWSRTIENRVRVLEIAYADLREKMKDIASDRVPMKSSIYARPLTRKERKQQKKGK